MNAKKFRKGVEYGSARWGNKKDIIPYLDPDPLNNVILTNTESLTMSGRPPNPKYARNKNVLVVGGSGSGKTRFFIKPNLMQCEGDKPPVSFVVTDPKGTVLLECGKLLKRGTPKRDKKTGNIIKDKNGKIVREPYKIKVLNTIDFSKSMKYNPFDYIRSEKDILKFVTAFISNTKGEDSKNGEDFWEPHSRCKCGLNSTCSLCNGKDAPNYISNWQAVVEKMCNTGIRFEVVSGGVGDQAVIAFFYERMKSGEHYMAFDKTIGEAVCRAAVEYLKTRGEK